jgi:hypothetical protein
MSFTGLSDPGERLSDAIDWDAPSGGEVSGLSDAHNSGEVSDPDDDPIGDSADD